MGFLFRAADRLVQSSVDDGGIIADDGRCRLSRLCICDPDGFVSADCVSQVHQLAGQFAEVVQVAVQVFDDLIFVGFAEHLGSVVPSALHRGVEFPYFQTTGVMFVVCAIVVVQRNRHGWAVYRQSRFQRVQS